MRGGVLTLLLVLVLQLTACGGSDTEQTLTVLAASSLTGTFADLATRFEEEHAGVDVELVLGSSTTLAEQAGDGAPGDVLATADETSMALAEERDALADTSHAFASNRLTLVAPADNPAQITTVEDLDGADIDYVTCAASAPCGVIARALLDEAGIDHRPASEEVDVKSVLARVVQGEADAGLVYRTDAVAAGDAVLEVPLPDAEVFATDYYVAPLHGDGPADLAAAFVALVRSDEARDLFRRAGFSGVVAR